MNLEQAIKVSKNLDGKIMLDWGFATGDAEAILIVCAAASARQECISTSPALVAALAADDGQFNPLAHEQMR